MIVAPWSPVYGHGLLARLVVDAKGRAVGRFPAFASYMMPRAQRHPAKWAPHHVEDARQETTRLDPRSIIRGGHGADLAIAGLAPGIVHVPSPKDGGDGDGDGHSSLSLVERGKSTGAWAAADCVPGRAEYAVTWYGHRNLWQEVADAYLRWVSWGQPGHERFGMTLTRDGRRLWLDHPRHELTAPG